MPPSLLRPPARLSMKDTLELAECAPRLLEKLPSEVSSSTLASVFAPADKPEVWATYENLLMVCLRTGDLASARECQRRLLSRFGAENDRIMALEGLVSEAEAVSANDTPKLLAVLARYDEILKEDGTNVPVHKRRAALLRSLDRIPQAVAALLELLDFSPNDGEAWAELADIYVSQGLYAQAVHALEEVLLLAPNAWNAHARLGEVLYMAVVAAAGPDPASPRYLAEALKRFCRSIELCDDYLRGYYGLKLTTTYLLKNGAKLAKQRTDQDDFALPDTKTLQRLGQLATAKLSEIVRRSAAKEAHWTGYDESEVAAARELLAAETAETVR